MLCCSRKTGGENAKRRHLCQTMWVAIEFTVTVKSRTYIYIRIYYTNDKYESVIFVEIALFDGIRYHYCYYYHTVSPGLNICTHVNFSHCPNPYFGGSDLLFCDVGQGDLKVTREASNDTI